MSRTLKLAYIGGGSLFVPSIVNGIGEVMRRKPGAYGVELALYDIDRTKAERMAAYANVLRRAWDVPLAASAPATRAEALDGADVVIVSVWLEKEHRWLEQVQADLGFALPEEGPGVAGWAVACAPWSLEVAREMKQRCPEALFVTLMNPTDVIAGYIGEAAGVPSVGMCVEVDGLRGALAYYFKVPPESIDLRHAGVNHDGWVLDLRVGGKDGYALWRERWEEMERDPDFHPGNRGILPILSLTGHLRSSGYHHWPLELGPAPVERWKAWAGKREAYLSALERALATGMPVLDPPGIHPERSLLNYPLTGEAVGRMLRAMATGEAEVLPLQMQNAGAVSNFPADAVVEVPARVQGRDICPEPVGAMPEWLGGYTRLLAIQRRLLIDYLHDGSLKTLKQALGVLPVFGAIQQLNAYAETLHERCRGGRFV